jgi:hypothetical protein
MNCPGEGDFFQSALIHRISKVLLIINTMMFAKYQTPISSKKLANLGPIFQNIKISANFVDLDIIFLLYTSLKLSNKAFGLRVPAPSEMH